MSSQSIIRTTSRATIALNGSQLGDVISNDLERKRQMLYETGADAVCEFDNGEALRVNKTLLAYESEIFNKVFFGDPPSKHMKISHTDSNSFKLFLDCLFGLKVYSVENAFIIYPIAQRFGVKRALDDCDQFLKPTELNENLCLTLNMASLHGNIGLVREILTFLETKIGIWNFFQNNQEYLFLLEPVAIHQILEVTRMNSVFWISLYKWGRNYIKKHKRLVTDVSLFFKEINIFQKVNLSHFESAESILQFHELTDRKFLDPNEVLKFIEGHSILNKNIPDRSVWAEARKDDKIVEVILFKAFYGFSKNDRADKYCLSCSTNLIYSQNPNALFVSLSYIKLDHKSDGSYSKLESAFDNRLFSSMPESSPAVFGINKKSFIKTLFIGDHDTDIFIKGVKISYTFLDDCKILKTSLKENLLSDKNLCFTDNVKCDYNVYAARKSYSTPAKRKR